MPRDLLRVAAAVGISALFMSGCGGGTDTHPSAQSSSTPHAVDLSTLDTGQYDTTPRKLGQVVSEAEGRVAEATRMGEAVIDPTAVDPTLAANGYSDSLSNPAEVASSVSANGGAVVEPVLTKYGMIAGHVEQASSDLPGVDRVFVAVLLLRFPDESSASNAAVEMDAVDSAVSRDNVPVPLTKYPTAHGHWRPTDPTLASTMAHGVFVIQTNVGNPTPDLQTLSSLAEKTFDAEIALLDHFQPTPVDKIGKLSKDPDGLLGRLVDLTPGTQPMLSKTVATYGPNGALTNQTTKQHEEKVYQKAGVDRLALWLDTQFGASEILRARDVGAASALLPDLTNNDDDLARSVDGVQNLPDAKCFEMSKNVYRKRPVLRFTCFVGYDRFVARVYGATETDARQRTAAQYALLVNPL